VYNNNTGYHYGVICAMPYYLIKNTIISISVMCYVALVMSIAITHHYYSVMWYNVIHIAVLCTVTVDAHSVTMQHACRAQIAHS
jgi:hypothetical protein